MGQSINSREKEKERLVELIIQSVDGCAQHWAEIIADYLLDNGVIVPPCKVGESLFVLDTDGRPREMAFEQPDIRCVCKKENEHCMATFDSPKAGVCVYRLRNDGTDIVKTVFLTREAAEQALKEREEK